MKAILDISGALPEERVATIFSVHFLPPAQAGRNTSCSDPNSASSDIRPCSRTPKPRDTNLAHFISPAIDWSSLTCLTGVQDERF